MSTERAYYDLTEVQRLVREGQYVITYRAAKDAARQGFSPAQVVECVLALTPADFHKPMESASMPGLWQDAYRTEYEGRVRYVKVQIRDGSAVVISFKPRRSYKGGDG